MEIKLQTKIDVSERVDELEKRIVYLEERLKKRNSSERASVLQIFGEGIMSLLFGVCIVGPVIAVVWGIIILLLKWFG